jgi:hypothetical protein
MPSSEEDQTVSAPPRVAHRYVVDDVRVFDEEGSSPVAGTAAAGRLAREAVPA